MPSEKDDPRPKTRKGSRKKSPADIAAEAEAAAAAAEKSQRSSDLSEPAAEAPLQASGSSDRGAQDRPAPDRQPSPPEKPAGKRQVENWLAARLAALDPGEDDEDISDPSTQIGKPALGGRSIPQPRATSTPSSWPTQSPATPRTAGPARPGQPSARRPAPTVPSPAPASVVVEPTRAGPSRMETEVDEDGDPPTLSLADAKLQGMILPEGLEAGPEARPDLAPTLDLSTVPHAPEPQPIESQPIESRALSPQGPSAQAPSLEVMVVGTSERTPPLPIHQGGELPSIELVEDEKAPIPQEPWPDFEPLSLPSEEIEPLDDAVPPAAEPGDARAARMETPNRSEVAERPSSEVAARDDQTWDLLGESDGRGRPAFDEDPTRHDDDRTGPGGWAATPAFGAALAGPGPARVMVGPGGAQPAASVLPFSTGAPAASPNDPTLLRDEQDLDREEAPSEADTSSPRSSAPVVKSAAAPVRPRSPNEEARYDALIAEVAQKSETPAPRTDAPRRKPGPFSRWNEDAEPSDPGDKRRTVSSTPPLAQTLEAARFSSQPETQTELKEPDSSEGLYDEMMFPPARGAAQRGEETSALLADSPDPTPMPPPPPILPRIVSPQSSALAAALRPLQESQNTPLSLLPTQTPAPERERERESDEDVDDPGSKTEWRPQKPVDLDKKPLADEKTEIRSFSPKIDTVGDDDDDENAPTTRMGSHEERVPPITAADLPQPSPPGLSREEAQRRVGPMTWVWVGVGTVAFLSPLALLVVIAIWWAQ